MSSATTIELQRHRPAMPPAELIDVKPIRDALIAHQDARQALSVASDEVTKLERQRAAAVEADRVLYADAIEAGKEDPGTPNVDAYEQQLDAARRHAAARKLVADRAFSALSAAVEEHQPEWQANAEARRAKAQEAWEAALDTLESCRRDLVESRALAAFVSGRSRRYATTGGGGQVPLRFRGSHTAGVESLIEALREFGQPPKVEAPALQLVDDDAA